MASGKVLIYGGRGALGATCVQYFKNNNFWVGCIDLAANESADVNIIVDRDADWVSQEQSVLSQVESSLKGDKLDAVICVAGGWAGGNASKELAKNSDLMWKQSVWSSAIAATVGANHLKTGGFLALTGANPALAGTPGMIGYGMAKAAVHQLTKSLAGKDSGLPDQSLVVSILPVTLDTPMNRKWMPKADFGTWTPLEFIAELFHKWTKNEERPVSGSLVKLITKDSKTELVIAE
ncbi:dihydropteridine reductase isoform X1 [Armigeres subalbatus]|uniref:dihydropteridine reductase isoform X1 n=1 Tax=Armigeres subalbatus TaxID=124917 RepID=UPI002ED52EB4